MKKPHIKLSTAGAKLLTTILIAGASFANVSYNPYFEYNIQSQNQNKRLEHIDFDYKLPEKDYKTKDFSEDSDTVLLARLVFGESRGSSLKEKISNAHTAKNRTEDSLYWNGRNLRESILKSSQYSCFNYNDVNRKKVMNPMKYDSASWKKSMKVAYGVLEGIYRDPTGGATHYHTKKIKPYWSKRNKNLTKIDELENMDSYYYKPTKKGT